MTKTARPTCRGILRKVDTKDCPAHPTELEEQILQ
jgi:hypothetical protein